jgi:hypothetical protein
MCSGHQPEVGVAGATCGGGSTAGPFATLQHPRQGRPTRSEGDRGAALACPLPARDTGSSVAHSGDGERPWVSDSPPLVRESGTPLAAVDRPVPPCASLRLPTSSAQRPQTSGSCRSQAPPYLRGGNSSASASACRQNSMPFYLTFAPPQLGAAELLVTRLTHKVPPCVSLETAEPHETARHHDEHRRRGGKVSVGGHAKRSSGDT